MSMISFSYVRALRRIALIGLITASLAATAHAADGPGTQVVRTANDTIAALLKTKATPGSDAEKRAAAKVTESVRGFLDIDELAQRALVDHWAKLTATQRREFLEVLRALIEDNYVKGLRANLDYQVAYLGEAPEPKSPGGDVTAVKTAITAKKKGRPVTIAVDYLLLPQKGKLRAFDVRTDGVSLVANYRKQFNKIIAKDGFDGLLAKMKKKRAAT